MTKLPHDMRRLLDLPQREPHPQNVHELLTEELSISGDMALWPVQGEALFEALREEGLLGFLPVGCGKTLISALTPTVIECERPLLLTRQSLKGQLQDDVERIARHFEVHPDITVWGYRDLSAETGEQDLIDFAPDLIVADEAHAISREQAARTMRVWRYFMAQDEAEADESPRLVAMSGTLIKKSIMDFWRLAFLSLDYRAPVPLDSEVQYPLSQVIDPDGQPSRRSFQACMPFVDLALEDHDLDRQEWLESAPTRFSSVVKKKSEKALNFQSLVRQGFHKRLKQSPGVVMSEGTGSCDASLYFHEWEPPDSPPIVEDALSDLDMFWERPDGELLVTAATVAQVRSQLKCGFHYFWDWPGGEPDEEWLEARKQWYYRVRKMQKENIPFRDTPLLIRRWFDENDPCNPDLLPWKAVEHRPKPPQGVAWLSEWLVQAAVDFCVDWVMETDRKIVIYGSHVALEEAMRKREVPVYGAGTRLSNHPDEEHRVTDEICYGSIDAQGTGRNPQYEYADMLILTPPPSGATMEQLIGRMHRAGQPRDEVNVFLNGQWLPQIRKAQKQAAAKHELGEPQKLIYGAYTSDRIAVRSYE